ncbi:MAG: hypothetical protein WCJ05_02615, partial [bacterium]
MLPSDKTRVSGGNNTTEPRSDKNQNGRLSTGEQVPFMADNNSLQSLNVSQEKISASVANTPISDISGINYSNASTKQDAPKPKNKGLGKTLAFGSL